MFTWSCINSSQPQQRDEEEEKVSRLPQKNLQFSELLSSEKRSYLSVTNCYWSVSSLDFSMCYSLSTSCIHNVTLCVCSSSGAADSTDTSSTSSNTWTSSTCDTCGTRWESKIWILNSNEASEIQIRWSVTGWFVSAAEPQVSAVKVEPEREDKTDNKPPQPRCDKCSCQSDRGQPACMWMFSSMCVCVWQYDRLDQTGDREGGSSAGDPPEDRRSCCI